MKPVSEHFKEKALVALKKPDLQEAMAANRQFAAQARQAAVRDPLLQSMKDHACKIKDHVLDSLPDYLNQYERQAKSNGIHVHWAETVADAQHHLKTICKEIDAKLAICGKSMIAAEMDAAGTLKEMGVKRYETDLGEYILQLAGDEPPSHVNGPAIHKTLEQIRELFFEHHRGLGLEEVREKTPEEMLQDVRILLREKFLSADVGIIGANFLVAETGANVLVSNEGNADLSALLPKTKIILASIEKVLPRMADAEVFLRLLCLSATGQKATAYQTFYFGKKKNDQWDGAENIHIILLDNNRSRILASPYRPILRCFRCGACMDNCPVYNVIGGHPYGWIYPGPMGVIWTSLLIGLKNTTDLAHACTLNGHCNEVCPMKIPLKEMIRLLREDQWERGARRPAERLSLGIWGYIARNPKLYHRLTAMVGSAGNLLFRGKGTIEKMPGVGDWTRTRDLPAFTKVPFNKHLTNRSQ